MTFLFFNGQKVNHKIRLNLREKNLYMFYKDAVIGQNKPI